jgi:hypothetical protein
MPCVARPTCKQCCHPLSDEADINRQNLCVERLGEAASKISADTKARNSDIPWREIVGVALSTATGMFAWISFGGA